MEFRSITIADAIRELNKSFFLPAIQREFRWDPPRIEKLFDSLMSDYPIASFLFWRVGRAEILEHWTVYEFIRDFDQERPHNQEAGLNGAGSDIELVLDGQQRLTALYIGLRGSYRYHYYRWHKTKLFLNLLKTPVVNEDDPEELAYQFSFREDGKTAAESELWYEVGQILNFRDADDAREAIDPLLASFDDSKKVNARKLVGRLHTRIHTFKFINFYEEIAQSADAYDRVLNIFVRINSGGMALEYSDLLLSTATAKWEKLNPRELINDFTRELNETGPGYKFGKDFVLKGCLYLTPPLPIQYMVKNFTRPNLLKIEENWPNIKMYIATTVRLISRFGFNASNIVSQLALLPISFYLMQRGNSKFDVSSELNDVKQQVAIRQWLIQVLLRGAFGASSDRMLKGIRDVLVGNPDDAFPASALNDVLKINRPVTDEECDGYLKNGYQGRYTRLILSLMYPDREWKDAVLHEDHIFPKKEFVHSKLIARNYDTDQIQRLTAMVNLIPNLELLTDSENLQKNGTPFDVWLRTRDADFRDRHTIPNVSTLDFEAFEQFFEARTSLMREKLKLAMVST